MTAIKATMEHIGVGGHIAGFDVLIHGDTVVVSTGKSIVSRRTVERLGNFILLAVDFKLGWARTEDFNIIYLYDKGDDNFGYAVNLEAPDCSEWGYAPFGRSS